MDQWNNINTKQKFANSSGDDDDDDEEIVMMNLQATWDLNMKFLCWKCDHFLDSILIKSFFCLFAYG